MALTRKFNETVKARAIADPEFRLALLVKAIECFLNDEPEVAKSLFRDYINAVMGFAELAKQMDKSPESLMRMLSKPGNPRLDNLSSIIACLNKHEGITPHLKMVRS